MKTAPANLDPAFETCRLSRRDSLVTAINHEDFNEIVSALLLRRDAIEEKMRDNDPDADLGCELSGLKATRVRINHALASIRDWL